MTASVVRHRAGLTRPRRAVVVTNGMQKGGVGKTTTTICLARAASVRHLQILSDYRRDEEEPPEEIAPLRTLVIDMDPQGNATTTLAATEVVKGDLTIADAIRPDNPVPLTEVIIPTIWEGVSLAPARMDPLTLAERLINGAEIARERRLQKALKPVLGDYDLVLIDNQPSLGLLLLNSLLACDYLYGVAQADQWSYDGLFQLVHTVELARDEFDAEFDWSGVLISLWRDTGDEKFWLGELGSNFSHAPIWDQNLYRIPQWVGIKNHLSAGLGLDESREAKLRNLSHTYRRLLGLWIPDPKVTIV